MARKPSPKSAQTPPAEPERGVHAASPPDRAPGLKWAKARAPHTSDLSPRTSSRPSALLDTRVIYCGDNLEQLRKLPDACVDLICIDPPAGPKPLRRGEGPPFNSNRNYEVFRGETREKRAFEDRHENTQACIDSMRPCPVADHSSPANRGRFLRKS